jgi:hypothetical protein
LLSGRDSVFFVWQNFRLRQLEKLDAEISNTPSQLISKDFTKHYTEIAEGTLGAKFAKIRAWVNNPRAQQDA